MNNDSNLIRIHDYIKATLAWFHVPAAAWSALIEFAGWVWPLTPLENWLRRQGGMAGYQTGFIEYYLQPMIYPGSLSHHFQIALGLIVLGVNLTIYWRVWRSWFSRPI